MGIYQIARDGSDLVRLELDPGFQTDHNYDGNAQYYFNDPVWDPDRRHAPLPHPRTGPLVAGRARLPHPCRGRRAAAGVVEDERLIEFSPLTDDEFHATFLPDGQTIVFETIEGADHQLWVGSTAVGASPRALAVTAHDFINYLVSPDGTQLIVSWSANENAAPEVVHVDIASGAATPLAIRDDYSWQRRAMPSD